MAPDQAFGMDTLTLKRIVVVLNPALDQQGANRAAIYSQLAGLAPGGDTALTGSTLRARDDDPFPRESAFGQVLLQRTQQTASLRPAGQA